MSTGDKRLNQLPLLSELDNADLLYVLDVTGSGTKVSKRITWEIIKSSIVDQCLPVVDTTAIVKDPSDASKKVRIDAGAITTATTRVITMGDRDVDLASGGTFAERVHTHAATDLISGTLAAARMPALTGDVTTSAGAVATTIANSAVTNAKMADMAESTIKGRASGAGTGAPTNLSGSEVATILSGNASLTQLTVSNEYVTSTNGIRFSYTSDTHGITGKAETNTFAWATRYSNSGGCYLLGINKSTSESAVLLEAIHGTTGTPTASICRIVASKKAASGSGVQALAGTDPLLDIRNNSTTIFTVNGAGRFGFGLSDAANFSGSAFSDPMIVVRGSVNIQDNGVDGITAINMGGQNYRKGAIICPIGTTTPYVSISVSPTGTSSTIYEVIRFTETRRVGIRTASPTAVFDVDSDVIRLRTAKTPASASDIGNTGDICWDSNYIYICVATNTWKRAALATW